jgi:hypothetical protein
MSELDFVYDAPVSARRAGWLFGPLPDLFIGCGILYAAWVALLALARPDMARLSPFLPLAVLCIGVPHYGVTLLRVYGSAEARARHPRAAYHGSAAILLAFLLGLLVPRWGAALITLYLTLSPWHYASQNYGLTLLFLRRRGADVPERARRLLRASFLLSYALVLVSYHRAGSGGSQDPLHAASAAYRFIPVGLPEPLVRGLLPVLLLLYLATLLGGLLPLRGQGARRLLPALVLIGTQAVWSLVLMLLGHPDFSPGAQRHAALAFIWVALGHCAQYLWVSSYHARAAGQVGPGALGMAAYLGWSVLLGAALWTVPAWLLAPSPGQRGGLAFESGLGLLVAAAVNLHHFLLDSVIWKLRDPRVGRLLLDTPRAQAQAQPAAALRRERGGPPSLLRCGLATAGALSALLWVAAAWEAEVGHRRAYAAGDLARLELAAQRLAAMGRDGPRIRVSLGRLYERQGAWQAARQAYEAALALDRDHVGALDRLSLVLLRLGRPTEALALSERALSLAPEREAIGRHREKILAAIAAAQAASP